ncbi:MAG: hypothetical protein IKK09_05345 [Clostridia bacterium]|nr:hypothetical protein [Clostridia bacterium]
MSDIFLCYRSSGAQTAKLFKKYMTSRKYDGVWYSDDEAYGNYKSDIPDLISYAKCAVLFITNDFFENFVSDNKTSKSNDAVRIECITSLEIVEIERKIQNDKSFKLVTVFLDRDAITINEQIILRQLFSEADILTSDSVNHFAQSNVVKFNTRKDDEEDLFENLYNSILSSEFFGDKLVGNFEFCKSQTTVDIILQDLQKPISIKFLEYSDEIDFYKKIERISSNVFEPKQNDDMISVVRCMSARESNTDNLDIEILFRTIEYKLFNKCIQLWNNERLKINEKIYNYDSEEDVFCIPNAMGLALMVITADNYLVFSRRSTQRRIRTGEFDCSIVEGLKIEVSESPGFEYDISDDNYVINECRRAYKEEVSYNDSNIDIKLNGIILDKQYGQWNIVGTIFTDRTREQLTQEHPLRKDTYEKNQLIFVPLEKETIKQKLKEFKRVGLWDTALAVLKLTLLRIGLDIEE